MSNSKPTQFFTWSDVLQSCIDPKAFSFPDADPSGLFIYGDDKNAIQKELSQKLGLAYDEEKNSVTLESTSTTPRQLPVEILPKDDAPDVSPPRRPLWSSGKIGEEDAPQRQEQKDDPKIAAFFAFKGGVGRTMSCFATAVRLLSAKPAAKVLYVDADVEAPGLTWMTEDAPEGDGWSPIMSWVDALCLVHDAEDWKEEALPLIVQHVRQSTISLDLRVGRREFFFMPAVRSIGQLEKLPITPENVVRRRDREWVIGDLLIALGRQLKVDAILVDLRAGITEFSSPLLLDPRVHTVIVSSCAKQSVSGTCKTLTQISRHTTWPLDAGNLTFLVTQVPLTTPPSIGDSIFEDVERALLDTWNSLCDEPDNGEDSLISPGRIDYDQRLISFNDLQEVAQNLPETSFWNPLRNPLGSLVDQLTPSKSSETDSSCQPIKGQEEEIRDKILTLTKERLEFAEQNEKPGILATPPIQKLVNLTDEKLPIAVVLGSKGSGKTFLWSQLVMAQDFATFAETVDIPWNASKPASIFPLLFPDFLDKNLEKKFLGIEKKASNEQEKRLSHSELKEKLKQLDSENSSLTFWLEAIPGRLGLPKETSTSLRKIEEELAQRDQYFVLVVDGLEEALQTGPSKPMTEQQKQVIRSLIINLPNQLQEIQAKHLGIVVFIRYDLARESIYQNFGQFKAKYRFFALKWSKADALRLVLWVLKQAEWPDNLSTNELTRCSYDDLKEKLQPFWGEKMGEKKEAFTDSWIIAALSDLRGRFQARDIIRFLSKAVERSTTFPLSPAAMRAAIEPCAQEKVKELEEEISELKTIFDVFRDFPEDQKITPIEESKLGDLSSDQKTFLADQGILIKDRRDNKFYMPEIIWKGLGFRPSRPGRIGTMRLQRLAAARER